MRCVALARQIARSWPAIELRLITSASLPDTDLLAEFKDRATLLDDTSPKAVADAVARASKDAERTVVVFDTLGADVEACVRLRAHGSHIVTLDDAGPGREASDLSINSLISSPADFEGWDYLVLPHPPAAQQERAVPDDRPFRLFLSFGQHDEHALLPWALETLLDDGDPSWEIRAAGAFPADVIARAEAIALGHRRGTVQRRPADFFAQLAAVDLAVLSGGLTLFSALHFGVPTVVIAQYPHQLGSARRFAAQGAAVALGLHGTVPSAVLIGTCAALAADAQRRRLLSQRARTLVDGRGAERVARAVVGILGIH